MNRSALLLLAMAVRSSIGTFRSSSRVRMMRMPSRPSSAALSRRATLRARSFSRAPAAPFTPSSSPPWPGSIVIVRIAELAGANAGGNSGGACGGGDAAGGSVPCAPAMSSTSRIVVSTGWLAARKVPNLGPSSNASVVGSASRTLCTRDGSPGPGRIGDGRSSASASNLTVRRCPSCATVALARGVASMVSRPEVPSGS